MSITKSLRTCMLAFGALALTLGTAAVRAAEMNGAGGTAIYPVLSKWADSYKKATGISINYQAIGSGGGIAQIKAKTVDFGNSDKPLTPEELRKDNLVQFPAVIIGIVPVVNLPDARPGKMVFNGQLLADIFLGKIKYWDAPAIKALNPGMKLPHMNITVVHRSDGSGTTFNFTDYLAKVSPEWKTRVGSDTSVSWPAGVGGKGNAGVAAYVQRIRGAIGYVEFAYALQNKMAYGAMLNADGKVVEPKISTFQAAAANADWGKTKDFYLILTNQPGAKSWPITAGTWILMRKDADPAKNQIVLRFVSWFLDHGGRIAEGLDYVPLPKPTIEHIKRYWQTELRS